MRAFLLRHVSDGPFGLPVGKRKENWDAWMSGINARRHLVEIVELKDHPWFLAVQFHPEFQSKPNRAHPLFAAFIAATMKRKGKKKK